MRVLVDLTYISPADPYSGVAVFSYSMLPALQKTAPDITLVGLCNDANGQSMRAHFPWMEMLTLHERNIHALQNVKPFLNRRALDRLVVSGGIDLFFVPFLGDRGLFTRRVPTVAVMHDAQGFVFGPNAARRLLYKVFTLNAARHVDHLVTISEYARQDILEKVRTLKAPVSVINQSLPLRSTAALHSPGTNPPYILSVNTLVAYKNPLTVLRAYRRIMDSIPHSLYFKGRETQYSRDILQPYIDAHGLSGRVKIISETYSPEQMDTLYRGASLFVSASSMEGFGLTPLEAAMRGVPVVCADIPSVREVTLGLLDYYSPSDDDEALAAKMAAALGGRTADMTAIAARYEEHYSTGRQAEAYARLLREMVTGEGGLRQKKRP